MTGLEFGLTIGASLTVTAIITGVSYSWGFGRRLDRFTEVFKERFAGQDLRLLNIENNVQTCTNQIKDINANMNNGWKCKSHLELEKTITALQVETENNQKEIAEVKAAKK